MRAVLTNLGSLGNVQPFVALAQELRRHGHQACLALAPQYASYVARLGFDFRPVGADLDYVALQRRDTAAVARGVAPVDVLRESLKLLDGMLDRMHEELQEHCRSADVLIAGHLQPAARVLHELTGLPFVSVHTNHFGWMQPKPVRDAVCAVVNPFRVKRGLRPLVDPVHTDANSPQLALYAISRHLRAVPNDWPEHWRVVGPFFVEEERVVDPALERFLDAGKPPVVITFSSIAHEDPAAMTDLLLEAVAVAGCRAIIQQGWSGLGAARELPPEVHIAGFVQHASLFPRAACVVHAGGSGVTAAALRAGVPTIVVPHIDDQPLWAELVRGIGCAGDVIPYRDLTPARLGGAIRDTLGNGTYRQRSQSWAARIRAERGVEVARVLIESHLKQVAAPLSSCAEQASAARRAAARRHRLHRATVAIKHA